MSRNILILSCGTRNKIIQYFKQEFQGSGKVFAADCSKLAPALYEADDYFIVPRINEPNYIDYILELCEKNNVLAVFTLIDPEISLLAQNADRFNAIGVVTMVSSYDVIERSFDKFDFYSWLVKHNYCTARTYENKKLFYQDVERELLDYPVFMKPRKGSASLNISKALDREDVEFLLRRYPDLLIQEYMNGVEIGADVYIDLKSQEVVSIFTKEKLLMRAGETDKSVSFKDEKLFELIKKFVKEAGYIGAIDIDIFKIGDDYYISEVNPRFGGGYLHAYECDVNFPRMILNNLQQMSNEDSIGDYEEGICMMKYNDVSIYKVSE
ncbi:MAG: ATP-grasp domain-containing protein [Peptostreptococcaceae bacterium]|nr:ATP-grasp domain-containing protein [Peptostreptococcaceae bacterium]